MEIRRESALPKPTAPDERLVLASRRDPRPALPRARPGRPVLPASAARRASSSSTARPARPSPRTSATRTRSPSTSPAATRTASRRSPISSSATTSPRSTTRPIPTSTGSPGTIRVSSHLWSTSSPILSARDTPRVLITGARGPARARARRGVPGGARARAPRARRRRGDARGLRPRPARGRLDGRRRRGGRSGGRGGRERARHAERRRRRRARRLLLHRLRLRRDEGRAVRRVGRDRAALGLRADEARRRAGGSGRLDRPLVVALRRGPATTSSGRCCGSGAERDEVSVVDDQRGCPTYVGHLAEATRAVLDLPYGTLPRRRRRATAPGPSFAEAIFEEAGLDCRVRRISTAEFGAAAPRPAYSVLRSEKPDTPRLPHWREGLRDCLARLSA